MLIELGFGVPEARKPFFPPWPAVTLASWHFNIISSFYHVKKNDTKINL